MIALLATCLALAAPIRLDRVEILNPSPGTWLTEEAPMLGARPGITTLRFAEQVGPVFQLGQGRVEVGLSLAAWTLGATVPLPHGFELYGGIGTRLALPAGAVAGVGWRVGPLRLTVGGSAWSQAGWRRPSWSVWAVRPSVGLGILRRRRGVS